LIIRKFWFCKRYAAAIHLNEGIAVVFLRITYIICLSSLVFFIKTQLYFLTTRFFHTVVIVYVMQLISSMVSRVYEKMPKLGVLHGLDFTLKTVISYISR